MKISLSRQKHIRENPFIFYLKFREISYDKDYDIFNINGYQAQVDTKKWGNVSYIDYNLHKTFTKMLLPRQKYIGEKRFILIAKF